MHVKYLENAEEIERFLREADPNNRIDEPYFHRPDDPDLLPGWGASRPSFPVVLGGTHVPTWYKPTLDARGDLDVPWRPKYIDLTELGEIAKPAAWVVYQTFVDAEHPERECVGGDA